MHVETVYNMKEEDNCTVKLISAAQIRKISNIHQYKNSNLVPGSGNGIEICHIIRKLHAEIQFNTLPIARNKVTWYCTIFKEVKATDRHLVALGHWSRDIQTVNNRARALIQIVWMCFPLLAMHGFYKPCFRTKYQLSYIKHSSTTLPVSIIAIHTQKGAASATLIYSWTATR